MELKRYEHVMVRGALGGTIWQNLEHFLEGSIDHQAMTFSSELQAKSLLQLEKKIPECFLICKFSVVYDRTTDSVRFSAEPSAEPKNLSAESSNFHTKFEAKATK